MYNEDPTTEQEDPSKLKRKCEEPTRSSRRKLLRRKIQRTVPDSEKFHRIEVSRSSDPERVMLVNPQSSKIPSSHNAMEQANQSEVPEAAFYPSPQGHNIMIGMPISEGLPGAPEFIPLGSPQLPPMDCPEEDLENHQYHEIMQMLLQAIHNQNRIMEECRNILTSIHHAITPAQAPPPSPPPHLPPAPAPPIPPPPPPPQPQNTFAGPVATIPQGTQPAQMMLLWNPKTDGQLVEESQKMTVTQHIQQPQLPQHKVVEAQQKSIPGSGLITKTQSSSSGTRKQTIKNEPRDVQPHMAIASVVQPQPQLINLQSVSSSKEPDKPTVYGPDGEFSSAYLRYVYSKSSTATSFANVLMKEMFNLEERISSNCNGVMGKKALEAERLDKIKRAVKRFYTDTDEEFQDLWKKCRKSIDSTNRNLKFVIMKKPTL